MKTIRNKKSIRKSRRQHTEKNKPTAVHHIQIENTEHIDRTATQGEPVCLFSPERLAFLRRREALREYHHGKFHYAYGTKSNTMSMA